jgi:sugar lactone lactonase YvrE
MSCEGGKRRVTRIADGEVTVLVEKFEGKKLNSPNDIVLDGIGGFYFSDPRYGNRDDMELDVEAVYYVDRRGKISEAAADLKKPNGLIFSPDDTVLYIADPGAETIWAYDVDSPGKLSNKRTFAPVGSDGMTVDQRGNIYCTWKGEVIAFSPEGKEVLRSKPPEGPANCLLVGKTLYVTARKGFYAIDTLVSGL